MTSTVNESTPTLAFYASLQRAYDHFNVSLFDGQLPHCLITLRSSSRHYGYHHKDRFVNREGHTLDELGLHPGFFTLRPVEDVLSTLVHEMVHHWQDRFGEPSKSNPHNRQWAQKMREVGLEPSSTGLPQGKDTGQAISHYIMPEGRFIQACRALLDQGFEILWFDRHLPREPEQLEAHRQALREAGVAIDVSPTPVELMASAPSEPVPLITPPPRREVDRVKYVCAGCGAKVWGASELVLNCGLCERGFDAVE